MVQRTEARGRTRRKSSKRQRWLMAKWGRNAGETPDDAYTGNIGQVQCKASTTMTNVSGWPVPRFVGVYVVGINGTGVKYYAGGKIEKKEGLPLITVHIVLRLASIQQQCGIMNFI